MVLPLLCGGRERAAGTAGVRRDREQIRDGGPAPQGDGGLRGEEVRGKVRERHRGAVTGYVGGRRTEARKSQQRHRDGLSGDSQPYQAAPYRKSQAEKRHPRPSASLHRPAQLRRDKPGRHSGKGAQ